MKFFKTLALCTWLLLQNYNGYSTEQLKDDNKQNTAPAQLNESQQALIDLATIQKFSAPFFDMEDSMKEALKFKESLDELDKIATERLTSLGYSHIDGLQLVPKHHRVIENFLANPEDMWQCAQINLQNPDLIDAYMSGINNLHKIYFMGIQLYPHHCVQFLTDLKAKNQTMDEYVSYLRTSDVEHQINIDVDNVVTAFNTQHKAAEQANRTFILATTKQVSLTNRMTKRWDIDQFSYALHKRHQMNCYNYMLATIIMSKSIFIRYLDSQSSWQERLKTANKPWLKAVIINSPAFPLFGFDIIPLTSAITDSK